MFIEAIKNPVVLFCTVLTLSSCSGAISLSGTDLSLFAWSGLSWKWVNSEMEESATKRLIYEECFGEENTIRLHQSMCVFRDVVFCFNHGDECRIYNIDSKQRLDCEPLFNKNHHNNAQFSHYYLEKDDEFPLLILSRGDYPPNQNDFYVVRIHESEKSFCFSLVKTIHNRINEAQYGGSWVIDDVHKKLYLYCMTTGDYRKKDDNVFCVISFSLPDICDPSDVILDYDDVLDRWEYTYLVPQGGTYYNGYLFFNVQSLQSVEGNEVVSPKSVIAINTSNGHIDAILPLDDIKETEGICVFDDKLYVSFKDGKENQSPTDIVFSLYEYSLPTAMINN